MNIPEKIKQSHLPELWSYVLQQKSIARKELGKRKVCATWGHIAYHLVLATAVFVLFFAFVMVDGEATKDWFTSLGSTLAPLFFVNPESVNGQTLLLIVGVSVVYLLVIPLLVCLVVKLLYGSVNCADDKKPSDGGITPKESARKLIKEIKEAERDVVACKWRDFYPMYKLGCDFAFNAYNFIATSYIALILLGSFLFGFKDNLLDILKDGLEDGLLGVVIAAVLWLVLFALVSFILMLVFLPLWKLSAIINARVYGGLNTVSFGNLEAKLETFIKDCEEEEEKNRRIEEQNRLNKADALYRRAMEDDEPDMEMIKEAAELGSPDACWEYGKNLYINSVSGQYTRDEQEAIHKQAAGFLEKAKDVSAEAELLWLACRATYEKNSKNGWRKMLNQARAIKKAGKISECFDDALDLLIQKLVQTIDGMDDAPIQQTSPKRGRFYCRFYNAGICNHQSNEYFVYKCTDPVNQCCTYALLNNGRAYEEY